jgi:WD40 repeat protein
MTATRDPDRTLRAWLDLMPDEAPDRVIATVLQATSAAPQARALPWHGPRRSPMNRFAYAALAAGMLAVLSTALVVGPLSQPTTTGRPVQSLGASSSLIPTDRPPASRVVPPAASRPNGPIVVFSDGALTSITTEGDQVTLPITAVHSRSCPTFSPDGTLLAYLTGGLGQPGEALVVSDSVGGNPRSLWSGRFDEQTFHQVVWSPDSAEVVATGALDATNRRGIVVGEPGSGTATFLELYASELPGGLAWSPDSTRLARIARAADSTWIEIRDVNGGLQSTAVTAPEIGAVAWSPDGEWLAYAAGTTRGGAAHSLHLVHPDGTADREIANGQAEADTRYAFMAWSWDGQLAVLGVPTSMKDFKVVIFDRQGRFVRNLGPFRSSSNLSLTWAPDGRSILLSSAGGGGILANTRPLVVPVDGGEPTVVDVPNGYYSQCPVAWGAAPTK